MIPRRVWLLIVIAALTYSIGLAFDLSPYLRGPQEWQWSRAPVPHWDQLWPLLIALAAIALWVVWLDRRLQSAVRPRGLIALGVGSLMIAALVVQLLALRAERQDPIDVLFDRSVDVVANGYFTVGAQITDAGEFLRRYPALMPTFPIHPQVHPPGIPLLYWLTESALESVPSVARSISLWFRQIECNDINLMLLPDARLASALTGMLLPTLANILTVWCVFQLAKARFGERAGWYAAAFWVVVPSVVLFPGSWSQVYPLLACLTWLSVDAGLAHRHIGLFFLAGVILSISTFMELGTAALGLFLVLYILARYVIDRRNPLRDGRFLTASFVAAAAGLSSIWIGYQVTFGVSFGQIVSTMLPIHTGYQFDRLIWIINHPYEYSVFLGLAFAGLLILASARALKTARTGRVDALTVSLGVGLVILSLVDPARDETARTWMLLMPFAVVIVSPWMIDPSARASRFGLVWGLIAVQLLVMIATLNVVVVGLYGPPPRSTLASIPNGVSAMQADFDGMARLVGYQVDRKTDHLILDLYWQGLGPVDHPYVVFDHLVDGQGRIAGQQDSRPQDGKPLMTCWQPGELYRDQHVIPLPAALAPGNYTLELGLYNGETGARVPVTGSDRMQDDHVTLEQIRISN